MCNEPPCSCHSSSLIIISPNLLHLLPLPPFLVVSVSNILKQVPPTQDIILTSTLVCISDIFNILCLCVYTHMPFCYYTSKINILSNYSTAFSNVPDKFRKCLFAIGLMNWLVLNKYPNKMNTLYLRKSPLKTLFICNSSSFYFSIHLWKKSGHLFIELAWLLPCACFDLFPISAILKASHMTLTCSHGWHPVV
jgi:hypothetical protein